MEEIIPIEKERVSSDHFYTREDVLKEAEARVSRMKKLKRATILGNGSRNKVRIIYKDAGGKFKQVHTTVWAVGGNFVTLKAGVAIPLNCIYDVKF